MGRAKLTTEEFIRRARLVHGDNYDYSKVVYIKANEPVCIICHVHGEFWQRPADHLRGCGCEKCGIIHRSNGNTMSVEQFVHKANVVHGNKYDYSKVIYVKSKEKVCIICKECGREFWQTPNQHLRGRGCSHCGKHHKNDNTRGKARQIIRDKPYGVGINDYDLSTAHLVSYRRWSNMLQRCYDKDFHIKKPTYAECTVCKEWLRFSSFKKWFDKNYVDGYVLDKDILVKGNKVYSPDTCCFVPAALNSLLTKRDYHRGNYPIGVQKPPRGRFFASIHLNGMTKKIGRYDTIEEAFEAYKQAKEKHIKEVAEKYYSDGKITERVYDALMKYEVDITD